jgi:transposase-like protein
MPRISPISHTKRKRWTEEQARAVLDAQARSRMSLRAFARREGLDPQRLRRWARQLEETTMPPAPMTATFVEVAQPTAAQVDVVLRSGVVLRVSETIEPMVLRRLVSALDEGAC